LFFSLRGRAHARLFLDSLILSLPITGRMLSLAALQRSFAAGANLLSAGVPLARALAMAGEIACNAKVRAAFEKVREGALAGIPLNMVMNEVGVFPVAAAHMVRIGEETGRTCEVFIKLADTYEKELDERTRRLAAALEPLMVVFAGIIVALMAAAVFMPVVSAIENFI